MLVRRCCRRRQIRLRPRRRGSARVRRPWGRPVHPRQLATNVAVAVLLAVIATPAAAHAQTAPDAVVHQPPVDAPVVDGFRRPRHPYGPGNRGIEYDTTPGQPVGASADGQVVFAGEVGGALHVTVLHADAVRTSYAYLDEMLVAVGQRVEIGEPVGSAGERLHFGARHGDEYFDPQVLFAHGRAVGVELLPFEVPPGTSPRSERGPFFQVALEPGRSSGWTLDVDVHARTGPASLADLATTATDRARLARSYGTELSVPHRAAVAGWEIADRLAARSSCSRESAPPRPVLGQARVAVLVGGLGSSSESASIDDLDIAELGYDAGQVARFSYAGGVTPESAAALPGVPAQAYASADTQGDLLASATRLADLLATALAQRPVVTVDIYGHSMGGVVARLALRELVGRGVDLDRVGLVATFGSPHGGADLATAVAAANTNPPGSVGLATASGRLDIGLDPDGRAVAQLAETSELVELLASTPVPPEVELLSIGASGDLVVPAARTRVADARNVTVGLSGREAHGELVSASEATDEVARALTGMGPGCESLAEIVGEELLGQSISYAEDVGGFAARAGSG